jgi:anti-sigma factor RsiW
MDYADSHLSEDQISRYLNRRLEPSELLSADSHLSRCDSCHGRLLQSPDIDERAGGAAWAFANATAPDVTHLTFEQLSAFADGRIGDIDREIVESHIDICSGCESELGDLRQLRSVMQISKPTAERSPVRQTGFRAMVENLRPFPAFGFLLLMFAMAAIVAFAISIPLSRENARIRARLAQLEKEKASLDEKLATVENLQNEVASLRRENNDLRTSGVEQARVSLDDGGSRIIVDARGNLSGLTATPQYEQAIRNALLSERVILPASLRSLRGANGTLMGSEQPAFKLIAPIGMVIETDRPTLRWSALPGATSYTVMIYDEALTKVATSPAITANEWTTTTSLARGKTYVWQVRALKDGEEVVAPAASRSRAKFRVLEQSKLEDIRRARSTHGNSHLVMGVVYAEAGLVEDAERELSELAKANPQSTTARKLLASVRGIGK